VRFTFTQDLSLVKNDFVSGPGFVETHTMLPGAHKMFHIQGMKAKWTSHCGSSTTTNPLSRGASLLSELLDRKRSSGPEDMECSPGKAI
jgi:hypothetical protein